MIQRDDLLVYERGGLIYRAGLTRPAELKRSWICIDEIEHSGDGLAWRVAEFESGGQHLLDANIAREWIARRWRRERRMRALSILDEFVRLHKAPDSRILEFTRTWGVLEPCSHGLPLRHISIDELPLPPLRLPPPVRVNKRAMADAIVKRKKQTREKRGRLVPTSDGGVMTVPPRLEYAGPCTVLGWVSRGKQVFWESFALWRFYSRQAESILKIASALRQDQAGRADDWSNVLEEGFQPRNEVDCMLDAVRSWLALGSLTPWLESTGAISWVGVNLFGELAIRLALAVTASNGSVRCDIMQKRVLTASKACGWPAQILFRTVPQSGRGE